MKYEPDEHPCPMCGAELLTPGEGITHMLTAHQENLEKMGVDIDAVNSLMQMLGMIDGNDGKTIMGMAFLIEPLSAQDILYLLDTDVIRYGFMSSVVKDQERSARLIAGLLSSLKLCLVVAAKVDLPLERELRALLLEMSHHEVEDGTEIVFGDAGG